MIAECRALGCALERDGLGRCVPGECPSGCVESLSVSRHPAQSASWRPTAAVWSLDSGRGTDQAHCSDGGEATVTRLWFPRS
jgi:hypothetical protein